MHWRDPTWLFGLLALPLLVAGWAWLSRWRRRAAERFARPERLGALLVGRPWGWPWWLRVALWTVAMAAVVVALAGPRGGRTARKLRARGVDVVLLVDVSASMRARDVAPSRFERMRAEVLGLLPRLAGHRVGAVAFAADTLEFPLTVDTKAMELFVRDLAPERVPVQGTDLGAAMVAAARMLRRVTASRGSGRRTAAPPLRAGRARVVLALTDGEDHEGHLAEGVRALRDIGAEAMVAVYAGRRPVRVPRLTEAGRTAGWVRDAAGRPAFSAFTPEAESKLREALRPLGATLRRVGQGGASPLDGFVERLARLRHGELGEHTITRWAERFGWPLALALLLLAIEPWLPRVAGRRRMQEGA